MTDSISVLERKQNSGRNPNYNYSLEDFDGEEKTAVRAAKKAAVKNAYLKDACGEITELGSGSHEKTQVYRVPNQKLSGEDMAVKVISCATRRCEGADLDEEKKAFYDRVVRNGDVGRNIRNEIVNCINVTGISNVLPFDDYDVLTWKCEEYKRIGIDYVLKMPLAQCMTDRISKYSGRKQGVQPEKPENLDEILKVGIDVCTALIELHKRGIIHRDIKPANIFWFGDNYCLGDFGIAANDNNLQDFNGTSAYWAPEQAEGSRVDHRADIYSLGLVLYELADTCDMKAHYEQRINRHELPELGADISAGLKAIIRNACAYNPNARYQTAEGLKEDLCWLRKNPEYVPHPVKPAINSYIPNEMFSRNRNKPANTPFGNRGRDAGLRRYLVPGLAWNAGKFWYETSCEPGSRFASLDIDKHIMPLSLPSAHVTDLPINVCTDPEKESEQKPLSQIIVDTQKIRNMYLIGEGGIGKTTALFSIMEDTYKDRLYSVCQDKKTIVPLFIELSKAPADYCAVYEDAKSTFIRRYLFMLLSSFDEKHLISENSHEMAKIMQERDSRAVDRMNILFENETDNVRYLLLLDGLNEVSRKQLSDSENDFIGTPAELIIDEIQELLRYKNISVVITSRADEALNDMENEFERFYLTGVSEDAVKEYLLQHYISFEEVRENERLMETLKIPLFLKMYSKLDVTSEVSTPGEILYAFFSERSAKYTVRERINQIKRDRRMSGEAHPANLITEKMQWFILDFLLPELGWYMEKNELYTVDLETVAEVIDPILKGMEPTDICGEYGIALFSDYHNGRDGSVNTRTCADQLLALGSGGQNYVKEIVDCCVNSLGILYVNNQSYGFVHQHIRDFFAALKNITTLKMSVIVAEDDAEIGYRGLTQFNEDVVHPNVSAFIGEILIESRKQIDRKKGLLEESIDLYRGKYEPSHIVKYGMYNLLKIIYDARKALDSLDLRYLDLRNCHFNGINLENTKLDYSFICRDNLFPFGHIGAIVKAIFSNSGKYIYTAGRDGAVKLWYTFNLKYIKTVIKIENFAIENIALSKNNKYLLVSTSRCSILYETKNYTEICKYKYAFAGEFDVKNNYLVLAYYTKPIELIDLSSFKTIKRLGYLFKGKTNGVRRNNIILISPDSKYIVFLNTEKALEIWHLETLNKIGEYKTRDMVTCMDFNSTGEYLGVAYYASSEKLFDIIEFNSILQKAKEGDKQDKQSFREKISAIINIINKKYLVSDSICLTKCQDVMVAKFVSDDKYFLIADDTGNIDLYDVVKASDTSPSFHKLQGNSLHQVNYVSEYNGKHNNYIVTAGDDGRICIWDLAILERIGMISNGDSDHIADVKVSPDGSFIVVAANEITIWNAKSGTFIGTLSTETYAATKLSFSLSGEILVAGFEDGTLIVYKNDGGKYIQTIKKKIYTKAISNVEVSKREDIILASAYDSTIKMFNIESGDIKEVKSNSAVTYNSVFNLYDDSILSCSCQEIEQFTFDETGYHIVEINKYKEPYKEGICGSMISKLLYDEIVVGYYSARRVICSPDNKFIAICWLGGKIEIRRVENIQICIAILNSNLDFSSVISFSPDSNYLMVSAKRNRIKIYETDTWECISVISGCKKRKRTSQSSFLQKEGHLQEITCIDCCKENSILLSGAEDGTVRLWERQSKATVSERQSRATVSESNIFKKVFKPVYDFLDLLAEKIVPTENNEEVAEVAYRCKYVLPYIVGLKLKNTSIKNIHSDSDLTEDDYIFLKIYGADID